MTKSKYVYRRKWMRALVSLFDLLGSILTLSFLRRRKTDPTAIKKILLARIDHLGDALLLRPVIAALHTRHPDLELDVLTTPENKSAYMLDSFLSHVIAYENHWFNKHCDFLNKIVSFFKMASEIRKMNYDAAIDFRGDIRMIFLLTLARIPMRIGYGSTGGGFLLTREVKLSPDLHQILQNKAALADWIDPTADISNLPVAFPASTDKRLSQMGVKQNEGYAVIHTGAGNPLKAWPASFFVSLAKNLLESNTVVDIFWVGTDSEKKQITLPSDAHMVDLRGLTDLQDLACLLRNAVFFVGNDSGPAHLAAAQGIPVIVLASGTNDINIWHPWTKRLKVIDHSERMKDSKTVIAEICEFLSQTAV